MSMDSLTLLLIIYILDLFLNFLTIKEFLIKYCLIYLL